MTLSYEFNDGGRSAYYKGSAGDCVVRAIAIATGEDYKAVYKEAAELTKKRTGKRSARNGVHKEDRKEMLRRRGFAPVTLPRGGKPTYAEAHQRYGDCIVSTTRHIAALKGGALHDTFDGRYYEWDDDEMRERKAAAVWVREVDEYEVSIRIGREWLPLAGIFTDERCDEIQRALATRGMEMRSVRGVGGYISGTWRPGVSAGALFYAARLGFSGSKSEGMVADRAM